MQKMIIRILLLFSRWDDRVASLPHPMPTHLMGISPSLAVFAIHLITVREKVHARCDHIRQIICVLCIWKLKNACVRLREVTLSLVRQSYEGERVTENERELSFLLRQHPVQANNENHFYVLCVISVNARTVKFSDVGVVLLKSVSLSFVPCTHTDVENCRRFQLNCC